jgi:hypothetical protein
VYADLKMAIRNDIIIPQGTDEEWDFEAHDSGSEQTLHDTAPAQIHPLAPAEDPLTTRAVLIDGAPGPLRVGAESLPSIPYVRTSDNMDEEDSAASVHPSRAIHAYLLGNRRVQNAEDGLYACSTIPIRFSQLLPRQGEHPRITNGLAISCVQTTDRPDSRRDRRQRREDVPGEQGRGHL